MTSRLKVALGGVGAAMVLVAAVWMTADRLSRSGRGLDEGDGTAAADPSGGGMAAVRGGTLIAKAATSEGDADAPGPPEESGRDGPPGGAAPGRAEMIDSLGRARAAHAAKRAELMVADPEAVHYFRQADRLQTLADGISPGGDASLRAWLQSGSGVEQERRAAFFQEVQDVVLVPEIFEIATNPDTENLFMFAYENSALPERLVLETEYFQAVDELLGFDATVDLDDAPGDVRHSGDVFVWEFGRRVEAAETFLESEVEREGAPAAIEQAARDLVRADLLAHIAEAYAAKSEYAELMELSRTIESLEAQLGSR